jgi:hypothetical protein
MNRLSSMVETLPGVARNVLKTTGRRYFRCVLVTNHVLSGAVIGAASRRRPVPAFASIPLAQVRADRGGGVVRRRGRSAARLK